MILPIAMVSITLALVCYTVAVWREHSLKTLNGRHLALFWLGLVFDTTGTTLMFRIAGEGLVLNFHGVTGLLAIVLMLFHAAWATLVLFRGSEEAKRRFHRFSVVVWAIWLVPYLSGAIFGTGF